MKSRLSTVVTIIWLASSPALALQVEVYVPQLVAGQGWNTEITIVATAQTEGTVSLFDSAGRPMTLDCYFNPPPSASSFQSRTFSLPRGHGLLIRTLVGTGDPISVGYAKIEYDAEAEAIISSSLYLSSGDGLKAAAGMPAVPIVESSVIPVAVYPGFRNNVGIAFVSTEPNQEVGLELRLLGGALNRSATIRIDRHEARYITEIFPERFSDPTSFFEGYVVITGAVATSALGISADQNAFWALPVTPW